MYYAFLNFFYSTAWSPDGLVFQWSIFVFSQNLIVYREGRAILAGDLAYVPKDGRRMPGVVTLHQHSETQSKPSYFKGHCVGAVSALIGTMSLPFSIPLSMGIHLGQSHIGLGIQSTSDKDKVETMGTRIVKMAIDFAIKHNVPSVLRHWKEITWTFSLGAPLKTAFPPYPK